jgi:gliotoxin/aspirochlorine/mycotoxins biosynthesis cytochrome P450 monooxygenase
VVTRAEDIKVIFHDSDRHIKAKNNDSGWLMGEVLGQCLGLLSQAEWSHLRPKVELPFLHKQVLQFLRTVQDQTKAFYSGLFEKKTAALPAAKVPGRQVVTIDAAQDTKMLPFLIVASLLYGDVLSTELFHELEGLIPDRERLFQHVIKGGLGRFWWSAYLPTEANKLLKRFQGAWLSFNKSACEEARTRGLSVPVVSLWEQMELGQINRTQVRLRTKHLYQYTNNDGLHSCSKPWTRSCLPT